MHKTVYVEKDEEITSIVGKIKNETSRDIFLVIPKGALLSQGMINLKLLKKEADRLEKELFIITGDEKAKKIIAKVGLKIQESVEESEQKKDLPLDLLAGKASQEALETLNKNEQAREIGSGSFFEEKVPVNLEKTAGQESLSSVREFRTDDLRKDLYAKGRGVEESFGSDFESFQKKNAEENILFKKESPAALNTKRPVVFPANFSANESISGMRHLKVSSDNVGAPTRRQVENKFLDKNSFQKQSFRQAEEFFSEKSGNPSAPKRKFFQNDGDRNAFQRQQQKINSEKGGKAKWFLFFLALLFLVSLSGWGYWNWPKVNVKIHPRGERVEGSVDFKIFSEQGYALGENEIKGILHELEVEKTMELESSGTGSGSSVGKASGKVVILNKYSQTSQSLVATTRLLSKEGKLFRLAKDVVVPGMNGEDPGKVEATVIADKAGEEYNIGSSQFTIEGFKGTPKYEKFEVTSSEAMKGGGSGDGSSEKKIVLQKDLDAARMKVMDEIGKELAGLVEEKIGQGQKYFLDSSGKEIIGAFADRRVGEEGETFKFTVKEKIKLISFDEQEIKKMVYEKIKQDADEGYLLEENKILFSYDKPIVDWEKKTMALPVSYQGFIFPDLNNEEIKKELLGKNEEEIKAILVKNSRLEKAEMEYLPAWSGRWPALERNLSIEVVSGEKGKK